jgi:hypothetical protein
VTKHTFKAYDHYGKLVLSVWTRAPGSYAAERAAFQARLDRFELGHVDVASDDPHEENYRMRARASLNTRGEHG